MMSLDSAIVYIIIWLAGGGSEILVRGLRGGGQNFSVCCKRGGEILVHAIFENEATPHP